jgi:hypothetical protein
MRKLKGMGIGEGKRKGRWEMRKGGRREEDGLNKGGKGKDEEERGKVREIRRDQEKNEGGEGGGKMRRGRRIGEVFRGD